MQNHACGVMWSDMKKQLSNYSTQSMQSASAETHVFFFVFTTQKYTYKTELHYNIGSKTAVYYTFCFTSETYHLFQKA
jgi:hypothetical protein